MNALPIPLLPGRLDDQTVTLVDARRLHAFLESRQDYSTWIKGRIKKYGFEENTDYLLHKFVEHVPHQGGVRATTAVDYFVTLDMAKELAMVERTAMGRQARRYFIDCEKQLRQLQQSQSHRVPALQAVPIGPLSKGMRQAINRQAWADVQDQAYQQFHARREQLIQQHQQAKSQHFLYLRRPDWAR